MSGFRAYEQKGVVLTATERVAVPPITLEVGGLEEVVTVEASALHAQAQSGERSGPIRADEVKDTQLRGRDFLGLLQGMPGVVDTNVRNAPGWNAFLGTHQEGKFSVHPAWISQNIAAPLTPIVVNGVAFAASGPSNAPAALYALHGATGKPLWQSEKTITSPLSGRSFWVGSGHVFVGTRDGTVYAFGFAMERH